VGVDISTRVYGGHVVVALRGELDIVDAARAAAAVTAVTHGGQRVIVDLSALASSIAARWALCWACSGWPGRLAAIVLLAAPQERVLRLLALTGLGDVFCVHASWRPLSPAAAAAGAVRCAAARGVRRRPGDGRGVGYWHPVIAAETGPAGSAARTLDRRRKATRFPAAMDCLAGCARPDAQMTDSRPAVVWASSPRMLPGLAGECQSLTCARSLPGQLS